MAVKIPPLLHKMSLSAQKAWYKKHGMEMPTAAKSAEPEGKSAAAAKRVKAEPRKLVQAAAGSVRAQNLARQQGYYAKGGRNPIGAMGSGGSNVMAGAGQSTIKDLKASIKAGFNPKVSLNPYFSGEKKKVNEAMKPDASMAMTHQLKMKMISDKDKRTLGKVAALMASQKNKDKKNEYVRQLGLKAMKAGQVDPARGHSPTRFGRETLKKEETEQVDEMRAQYKRPSNYPGARLQRDNQRYLPKRPETPQEREDRLSALATGYKAGRWAHGGKYEQVEIDSMNEVTKKEAEATFGGPVKEKPTMAPGKQPAGYRYVRSLARKAMKAGLKKEEVEQIDEGFNKSSPAHMKARDLVSRSSMKAVYHSDGSATIHVTGDENVSSATKVDHIHRDAGLDHNKPASAYKNSTKNKGGLTFKTKESDGSHQVHISYKGIKEEVELTEAPKDAADVGEYDYEGDMAKSQLRSILANAKRLHDMLGDKDNLPEWVQSKITLAEDYILTAANYMEGEMNEEIEQVDEISEPYGTKKLRRQMAIDDRMAARAAAHPFVEPEWLTKEKEKAKQAAEKKKVKKEEVEQVDEKINLVKAKMGDVIKDFQKSDAPQFKGKSQEKRREMAVAAKLGAEREAGMREEAELDEGYEGKGNHKPGWMLRADPKLAKKLKAKTDLAKKRQATYGNPAAGKSVKEEAEQIDEQSPAEIKAKYYHDQFDKVKPVKAYDKEGKLVGHYRSMDHAKQMKPGHTYKVEEEVVTEAEGTVAVTPREKALAAHHGDKTRITFGDVIKARIKSAKEKAMKGKE